MNPWNLRQRTDLRFAALAMFLTALSTAVCPPAVASAQDAAQPQAGGKIRAGRLIRVTAPITSTVVERVIHQAQNFESQSARAGTQAVIIFEIEPGAATFGAARDLAQAITELSAQTVAYIPQSDLEKSQKLRGHAVLVALACQQIAMASDAQIGEAGIDDEVIQPSALATYEEIANARRNVPAALAKGMLDRSLQVFELETAKGRLFATSQEVEQIEKDNQAIRNDQPAIQRGEFGLFTGDWGFKKGFVQYLVNDRHELAQALSLPQTAVEVDPSLVDGRRAVQIALEEPFSPHFVNQVQRSIQRAIDDKDANLIILTINSNGGAPEASKNLAQYIASLPQDKRTTVAFVKRQAGADAAFIAMACTHLLMAPDSTMGGGVPGMAQDDMAIQSLALQDISTKTGRPHSVMMAMLDPMLTVYEYRSTDGRLSAFSDAEVRALPNPGQWTKGPAITTNRTPLTLNAETAYRLGIATEKITSFDELQALYSLEVPPESIQPTWLDTLVNALTQEGVMWALLLIGGSAFFIEMQSPGTGIGGFIACICFLLFFWGNYLDGTAGWLEVLLFVSGLIFVLLEIFVIPGMGIFGLGGGILIVASLVMAMQSVSGDLTDNAQLKQLQKSLFIVATAGIGMVVVFALVRRYFPKSGPFGSLVLAPPEGEEQAAQQQRELGAAYDHLVGETGTAATALRPAGKVKIDNTLHDVVTDGTAVEKGEEVVVTKVQGSRIVVRPAKRA